MHILATKHKTGVLAAAALGLVWLVLLSELMIADVWDETNALVFLASGPGASLGVWELTVAAWRHQFPWDIYRPLGSSLALALGRLFEGDFVWLRYCNALLVLASTALLARTLMLRYQADFARAAAFFVILLFSASGVISATWFANVFDAACLFFLALAIHLHASGRLAGCAISFALAAFCKETHVLALPLFALLFWEDRSKPQPNGTKARVGLALAMSGALACYWLLRHAFVPVGSDADIHGFGIDAYATSYASFAAGFLAQTSSFTQGGMMFWLGLCALVAWVVSIRNFASKLAVLAILGLCGPVYWGMFGYQGDHIISHHNFVGRLYLVPFALTLFVALAVSASRWPIMLVAALSVWGMGVTWRQHDVFQQTYAEIYQLADSMENTLFVHFPEKPLDDPRRGLRIGDYPGADVRIDTLEGGIDAR